MYRSPESLVEHSSLEDHASSGPPEALSPAAPIEQHGSVCRNIYSNYSYSREHFNALLMIL